MQQQIKTGLGVALIIIIAITVGAFVWVYEKNQPEITQPDIQIPIKKQNTGQNNNIGIANPASVHCTNNGGTLEIRTGADGGQIGYCRFSDGSECDEWAYYRGECQPGGVKLNINCICNDQCGDGICQDPKKTSECPCGETAESCSQDCAIPAEKTSNWQTYRNEKYGFEVNYPKDWAIDVNNNSPKPVGNVQRIFLKKDVNGAAIIFTVFQNLQQLSASQWLQKQNAEGPLKESEFNGYSVIKSDNPSSSGYFIYLPHGESIISIDVPNNIENTPSEIFNQILSTFKFIN
ncbi:MAG: DUF333 domain-containing protein [Parcubacteria group bacterium]|jgi:putative hemolysin